VRRVLESLIAVNDQSGHVFALFKRLFKRLKNELIVITRTHMTGYNLIVEQIFDGGEVQPRRSDAVLRDVSHPFLVGSGRCKFSLQNILRDSLSDGRRIATPDVSDARGILGPAPALASALSYG